MADFYFEGMEYRWDDQSDKESLECGNAIVDLENAIWKIQDSTERNWALVKLRECEMWCRVAISVSQVDRESGRQPSKGFPNPVTVLPFKKGILTLGDDSN